MAAIRNPRPRAGPPREAGFGARPHRPGARGRGPAGVTGGGRGIACAGNWILDVIHDIPAWPGKSELVRIGAQVPGLGGGAANVAAGLAAMGVDYPVVPVGLIGAGRLGDELLSLAAGAGLDTARLLRTTAAATSQTHVMNVPGDSRTFFHHAGANDLLGPEQIDVAGLAALRLGIFYLGYLNLLEGLDRPGPDGRPVAARVLAEAREHGMTTCVDLVSIPRAGYRETVEGVLPEIDVLFLNEIEASRATGRAIAGPGDRDGMIRAAGMLAAGGVRRAVVLHSAELTVWAEAGDAHVHVPDPVPEAEIAGAVGAGDAFAAGVMHGLHEGWGREDCADLGSRAAAACLRVPTATGGLGPALLKRG